MSMTGFHIQIKVISLWSSAADLRGFGRSDRPKDVSSYHVRNLVKDVEGDVDIQLIGNH